MKSNIEDFHVQLNAVLVKVLDSELRIKAYEREFDFISTLKLPIGFKSPEGKSFRLVEIESFDPVPCGGTHIENTDSLQDLQVKKVQFKKGILKISYNFKPNII